MNVKPVSYIGVILGFCLFFQSCVKTKIDEVNIGFIAPLTTRATDLGEAPSYAMQLAVEEYNAQRKDDEIKVNLYLEDDKWDKNEAIPAYTRLRSKHNINLLFISNTDGTVAIQDSIIKDNIIAINPLNNDDLLGSLNKNTFTIAKSTEEANGIIGERIVALKKERVAIFYFDNDFMTRARGAVVSILDDYNIAHKSVKLGPGETDFTPWLEEFKAENYDAYVFFGYKEFGFGMKQARTLGIEAQFFGSTVLLDPLFYSNSEGAIVGTECTFFTPQDGNILLANDFLKNYEKRYGGKPYSVWPPMQAYDGMKLILGILKKTNSEKPADMTLTDWIRQELLATKYYQGVCGNISIQADGTSRGIYFSLYKFVAKGKLEKVQI